MSDRNVYDVLEERGFIQQCTHPEELKELLGTKKISFYIGFDPTADSLHVGHFLTVMAMSHLQKHGHKPIALMGGGTGMIGDPTDRIEMRKILTPEQINYNLGQFKIQLSRFMSFEEDKAIMANNADWLMSLEYIPFLRDIGVHFSVNRMLSADSNKSRFEKGLSFLEFNYMILQGYDFLELNRRYGCVLQMGGKDQWSNIISGIELIRRVDSKESYGLTLKLLETSDGRKMGKTADGALWLDKNKTSPYDFYQYFRNIEDASVINCLKLLTFIELDEIKELEKLTGQKINQAKEVLAYEVTKLVHGEEAATQAQKAAKALFEKGAEDGSIPKCGISKAELEAGIDIITLLEKSKLITSRNEGRRAIEQGGIKINDTKIESVDHIVTVMHLQDNALLVQKGKKSFCKVVVE